MDCATFSSIVICLCFFYENVCNSPFHPFFLHSSFSFLQLLGQRQLQLGHLVLPINRRHGQVARAHVGASVTLIFCRSIDDVALLSLIVTLICIDYSIEKLASVKYIAFGMRARYEKRWDGPRMPRSERVTRRIALN
jgi:hypothetical protein